MTTGGPLPLPAVSTQCTRRRGKQRAA